jgi:hypothetical protein
MTENEISKQIMGAALLIFKNASSNAWLTEYEELKNNLVASQRRCVKHLTIKTGGI